MRLCKQLKADPLLWSAKKVRLHIFSEISWFPEFFSKQFRFLHISSDFFRKSFWIFFEKRNLNAVTSELDSESLSTLRKIIFKRDSCKLLVYVTSMTSAFIKFQKIRKFQKHQRTGISTLVHTVHTVHTWHQHGDGVHGVHSRHLHPPEPSSTSVHAGSQGTFTGLWGYKSRLISQDW